MNEDNPIMIEIRRRNLKQYELARAVDSDPATVNRVISGERILPVLTKRIADHLGLPFVECFPKAAEKLEQIRLREDSRRNPVSRPKPKPTHNEVASLRKQVKHIMVDLGLDREGSYDLIVPHLGRKMNRPIHKSQVCAALTGYRNGNPQALILENLMELLQTWPPEAA